MVRRTYPYYILIGMALLFLASCGSEGGRETTGGGGEGGGSGYRVAMGGLVSNAINITNSAPGDQSQADSAFNTQNNLFFFVWSDARDMGNSGLDVYGAFVNGTTGAVTGELAIANTSGNQIQPSVAFDTASKRFLVVFTNSVDSHIYGRFVNGVTRDFTDMGNNFVISMYNTTVPKYIPYDSGYEYHPDYAFTRAINLLGTGSITFSKSLTIPDAAPAIINIPGAETSNRTSILPGSLIINEGSSEASSVQVGYDDITDCDAYYRCVIKGDRSGGYNLRLSLGAGTGSKYSFTGTIANTPLDWSSSGFKVYYDSPAFGNVIGRGDGAGGVTRVTSGGALTLPKIDSTTSSVSNTTGAVTVDFIRTTTNFLIGTGDGTTTQFNATLTNTPVTPGSLKIYSGGALVGTDTQVSSTLGNITGATLVTDSTRSLVFYNNGYIANLTFSGPPVNAAAITASYSSDAPASGVNIYAEYNTLTLNNIFDPDKSYIDYTGNLYLTYQPLAAPPGSTNVYAAYRVVQNSEDKLSSTYQHTAQESPNVVYNNVLDTFHVVWLDTSNKNRYGFFAIPGTSLCSNDWGDSLTVSDTSYESQGIFTFWYTNLAEIDTKIVRYRDVSFADYLNGDGSDAANGPTHDYANDMGYSYYNGTIYDIDEDWQYNRDLSPIDSEIIDASAYRVRAFDIAFACAATSESYKVTIDLLDSRGESSPTIEINPVTGNPIIIWSSSEQPLIQEREWSRGFTSTWSGWTIKDSTDVTRSADEEKQKIHASRREFDTWYDRTYQATTSTTETESAPSAATDIYKNRMLVAWESQGSSSKDIYGQLVDLQSFNPYGSTFGISTEQYDQSAPKVSFDTVNQRYMVVWEDARNTAVNISNMDIFGQFVDPQGQLSGSNFPVTVTTSNQISPAVCFGDFEQSKFLVAWKDGTVPGDAEIYGQLWEFSQAPQMAITYDNDGDGVATPLYTQAIDYGGIDVGYSNTVMFYIENHGNAPLTINSITPGPGVSFAENPAIPFIVLTSKPNTINPGVKYPMYVLFHPPQVYTYSGIANSITLTTNGGTTTVYFSGFGKGVPVQITTPNLPDGAFNTYYSATLAGTGGTSPYFWNTVSGGAFENTVLPAMGLKLNKNTGLINGTLGPAAPTSTITIRITDAAGSIAEKSFTIYVNSFSISTTTLIEGKVGVAYAETLAAAGSPSSPVWTDDGRLPTGLALDPSSGVISGTPSTQGTYPFTITLTDASSVSITKDLSIVIKSTLEIEPTITPPASMVALPNAVSGENYYYYIQATTNGVFPYTWSMIAGSYPAGLGISPSTGSVLILYGTVGADVIGSYSFVMKVTDYAGNTAQRTFKINASNLKITTDSLPDGLVGQSFTNTLSASGGLAPYTWTLKGTDTLPTGLGLSSGGVISGTVLSTTINKSFTVVVTDQLSMTAEKKFTLSFKDIAISSTSPLAEGFQNEAYSNTLTGVGGTVASYAWSMSGTSTLPTGLSLNASTGVISGTPTVSGNFAFTVQLSDASQSTTKAFTLNLVPALSITTSSPFSAGTLGTAYPATTLAGTGGKGTYDWTWVSANAPPGLALATTGTVSGTPTTVGTYNFNITLTDTTTTKTAVKAFAMSVVNSSGVTPTPTPGTGAETAEVKTACYIATAAYGSYLDPHVEALRGFRDSRLMTNALGRKFVAFYYRTSPPIADYIAERPALRAAVRTALTPIVYGVKYPILGFAMFALSGAAAGYGLRRRLVRRGK